MNKKLLTTALVSLAAIPALSQKSFDITVVNDHQKDKENVPIVLKLEKYGIDVKSALVTDGGKEIPCQIDDINQDGTADELCFTTNVDAESSKKFIKVDS